MYDQATSSIPCSFLYKRGAISSTPFFPYQNTPGVKLQTKLGLVQFRCSIDQLLRTTWCLEVQIIHTIGLYAQKPFRWSLFRIVWLDTLRPVAKKLALLPSSIRYFVSMGCEHQIPILSCCGSTSEAFPWPMYNIRCFLQSIPTLEMTSLAPATDSGTLICVHPYSSLAEIRQAIDSGKSRFCSTSKSPFLNKILK